MIVIDAPFAWDGLAMRLRAIETHADGLVRSGLMRGAKRAKLITIAAHAVRAVAALDAITETDTDGGEDDADDEG
jgi:hypothetical protein